MPAMTQTSLLNGADADVLIVGAGPAGLALAVALHDAGLQVQLLEQQPRAALDQPADDGREIALTHRARQVMVSLGLWQHLPPGVVSDLRAARVLDGDGVGNRHGNGGRGDTQLLRFDAPNSGAGPLGWLVPNHQIRRAALQAVLDRPGITLHADAHVKGLQLPAPGNPKALASISLADGRQLRAPLVVAADSRLSATRRLAGIGASLHDFGRSVVVGAVAHAGDNEGTAWECFR